MRLIAGLLATLLGGCAVTPPPRPPGPPDMTLAQVLAAVRQAPAIRTLPPDLTPSLSTAARDVGFDSDRCEAGPDADTIDPCVFGDRAGATDVILWGDSRAGTWLPAMREIALRRHWRLQFFGKPGCPAAHPRPAAGPCDRFRAYVIERIRAVRPELLVMSNVPDARLSWGPAQRQVVLGDIPVLAESGPSCLVRHARNVPACFTTRRAATGGHRAGNSIPVSPWLCSAVCTPVIGNVLVYRNRFQLTATYARMLSGVLSDALDLPAPAG
nr:SGNH hydrolase domain-containing protein [uncultured Actinoplanes sp.]